MIFRAITKKRKSIFLLLSVILLLLSSCASKKDFDEIYTRGGFSAEICWTLDGREYSAKLVAGAPRENGEERDLTFEFIVPERLRGLTVTRKDGKLSLGRDDMTAELHNQAILKAANLLCADGNFSYKARTELGGRKTVTVTRLNGNERSDIWLDAESRAPVRIIGEGYDISVVWFEFSSLEATE